MEEHPSAHDFDLETMTRDHGAAVLFSGGRLFVVSRSYSSEIEVDDDVTRALAPLVRRAKAEIGVPEALPEQATAYGPVSLDYKGKTVQAVVEVRAWLGSDMAIWMFCAPQAVSGEPRMPEGLHRSADDWQAINPKGLADIGPQPAQLTEELLDDAIADIRRLTAALERVLVRLDGDVAVPPDVVEFGTRNGIENFTTATYTTAHASLKREVLAAIKGDKRLSDAG
jgi:hypothetical protein